MKRYNEVKKIRDLHPKNEKNYVVVCLRIVVCISLMRSSERQQQIISKWLKSDQAVKDLSEKKSTFYTKFVDFLEFLSTEGPASNKPAKEMLKVLEELESGAFTK